jgi:hypothetical protein
MARSALFAALLLSACTSPLRESEPDSRLAARLAAADPRLGPLLASGRKAFVVDGKQLTSAPAPAGLSIRIGREASAQLSVSRGSETLHLLPVGVRPVLAQERSGSVTYREALPGKDVIVVASCESGVGLDGDSPCIVRGLELLMLARNRQSTLSWSWRLSRTPGLASVRRDLQGGLVFGAEGVSRLRIPPPYALDASGIRRNASLELADDLLTVSLSTDGLEFPVLLDPAIETSNWEPRVPSLPPRASACFAWDSARQRLVLFGGNIGFQADLVLAETWEWDGTRWLQKTPRHSPPARRSCSLISDTNRGVAVLFGGEGPNAQPFGDTWEWNGEDWVDRSVAGPPARTGAALAFDAPRGRVVLFGGAGTTTSTFLDTWEWDGAAWTQVASSIPGLYSVGAIAYHPATQRTVLVAPDGTGFPTASGTWEWDGASWLKRTTTTSPAADVYWAGLALNEADGRLVATNLNGQNVWFWDGSNWQYQAATLPMWNGTEAGSEVRRWAGDLVFDGIRQRPMVLGGFTLSGFSTVYWEPISDIWEWDGQGWLSMPTSPPPRDGFALAWDGHSHKTILFGGRCTSFDPQDLWEWDGTEWTRKAPAYSPPPLSLHGMAFDLSRDRLVVFGGVTSQASSPTNATWEWDGVDWQLRSPVHSPAPRAYPAMTYDAGRQRVLVFGGTGLGTSSALSDLWEWDGNDWAEIPTTGNPPGSNSWALAADIGRQRLVLWGPETSYTSATWELVGSTWTQRTSAYVPAPYRGSMTFDLARNRVLLFCATGILEWDGVSWKDTGAVLVPRQSVGVAFDEHRGRLVVVNSKCSEQYLETWEYHVRGGACSTAAECDTGFCVDGVCCESACGGGAPNDCLACSVEAGGSFDGICGPIRCPILSCHEPATCDLATGGCLSGPASADGSPCNDHDPCTVNDACQAGLCEGSPSPNGISCGDAHACMATRTCQAGVCVTSNPVPDGRACWGLDACKVGTCLAGACTSMIPRNEGSTCDDADSCTLLSQCQAGQCVGRRWVVCLPLDQCHDPGACDPMTGGCTNPPRPDGTACDDGDACTQSDLCLAGVCRGGNPVVCAADDAGHRAGTCDSSTGLCTALPVASDAGALAQADTGSPSARDAASPAGADAEVLPDRDAAIASADAEASSPAGADAEVLPDRDAAIASADAEASSGGADAAYAAEPTGCGCGSQGGMPMGSLGYLLLALSLLVRRRSWQGR